MKKIKIYFLIIFMTCITINAMKFNVVTDETQQARPKKNVLVLLRGYIPIISYQKDAE